MDQQRRREQFEYERMLRQRLLDTPKHERRDAYTAAYSELFNRFPDHATFLSDEERVRRGKRNASLIAPLLNGPADILEVGCGKGDVVIELARIGHRCVGTDPADGMVNISREETKARILPGTADTIDFPDASFDLVFSQQVLEHLHPDDALDHIREACRVLRPGGVLAIETPNQTVGPQDVSREFSRTPQGLHLKEWSVCELADALKRSGFRKIQGLLAPPVLARRSPWIHRTLRVPAGFKSFQDRLLRIVPGLEFRTRIGKLLGLEDLFLFGRKPG